MQYFMSHPTDVTDDIERIKEYLISHYASEDIPIECEGWLSDQALIIYNLYITLAMHPDGEEYDLLADIYPELPEIELTDPLKIIQELEVNLVSVTYIENIKIKSVRFNKHYAQGVFTAI